MICHMVSFADEIVDAVNEKLFNGEQRSAVQIALEVCIYTHTRRSPMCPYLNSVFFQVLVPVVMLTVIVSFFATFRRFFGCVGDDAAAKYGQQAAGSRVGTQIDVSTRSYSGLLDQSTTSSHFLDDGLVQLLY